MASIITNCPMCNGKLLVSALQCENCGLGLQNKFELNPFNYISDEQMNFLLTFLKHQGNLKLLQESLNISYPSAKKKLQELLEALNLVDKDTKKKLIEEDIDMSNLSFKRQSNLASDIVKEKLYNCSGRVIVHSATGKAFEFHACSDGISFESAALPIKPNYKYSVFDTMVDCLRGNGGKARKGNGRSCKLGEPNCDDTTLVGYIAKHYAGKRDGDSVFDPVFLLAAILDWAEIANNCRGYVEFTASYIVNQV